jgi:hypothetical protein
MWTARRVDKNVLVMEMYRFARGAERLSEATCPILTIQEILTKELYRGNLTLLCTFETRVPLMGAKLALESPCDQRLWLDGVEVLSAPDGFYVDRAFETVALPDIAPGSHELMIRRFFEPLQKPTMAVTSLFENLKGVELEPAYLIGDFAVTALVENAIGDSNCIRLYPRFVLNSEPEQVSGELSSAGYPFYAGSFELSHELTLSEDDAKANVFFELDGLNACVADVRVNGAHCGSLQWAPYRVDLSGKLAPGVNLIELTLHGTLRNLLGPWHRPVGEIGACWGGYAYPNLPWLGVVESGKVIENWYEDRMPDREGWTERYLVLPFGVVGAKLSFE